MALRYQPTSSETLQGPDPLTDSWTFDSAINLFSWNMPPDPFFDLGDEDLVSFEPRDGFDGLALDLSSDPESDDQPPSPPVTTAPTGPSDMHTAPTTPTTPTTQSSPEPRQSRSSRRRRLADDSTSGSGSGTGRNAAKRAAHNVIEKRYRTNMNAKFVALEKACAGGPSSAGPAGSGDGTGVKASSSSSSLKKSEILSNAIAYMHDLQEQNRYLHKEIAVLKQSQYGIWGGYTKNYR